MRMRPDTMEGWGAAGILKEAARLLHKHFHLFLPFFLAFQLPSSFLSAFQTVFLNASGPSLSYTSFLTSAFTTPQGSEMDTNDHPPVMLSLSFLLLVLVFMSALAVAAFTYIVAYIYSNAAGTESDDDAITKNVFKLLPRALFRMFVTQLWIYLAMIVLTIPCAVFVGVLNAIVSAIIGGPYSGPTRVILILLMAVPYVVVFCALAIMFALAQFIAVLEPEKYGRAALKQSSKYAKGRAGTIVCIFLSTTTIRLLIFAPALALAHAALPLWVEILVTLFMSILSSSVKAYVATASVVMYFVCKSNFDAALPEYQRGSNVPPAENPYEPLVHGSTTPNSIGEP